MASGMTRREQWALIGVVALIAAGLGFQAWQRAHPAGGMVTVAGQGRWEKLAAYEAGTHPPPVTTATAARAGTKPSSPAAQPSSAAAAIPPAGGIDLNRATTEELDRLPGIGAAKARAIIELRARRGGFTAVDQLDEVSGVGPKLLERIRPYVKVEAGAAPAATSPTLPARANAASAPAAMPMAMASPAVAAPAGAALAVAPRAASRQGEATARRAAKAEGPGPLVDINSASQAALEQVKGIGPVLARRIVADRAQRGPFRRVEELTRVKGIGPASLQKMRMQIFAGPGAGVR